MDKMSETNSDFMWNSALREKNFYFKRRSVLVSTKCSFLRGEWPLGYDSMKFRYFADIS